MVAQAGVGRAGPADDGHRQGQHDEQPRPGQQQGGAAQHGCEQALPDHDGHEQGQQGAPPGQAGALGLQAGVEQGLLPRTRHGRSR